MSTAPDCRRWPSACLPALLRALLLAPLLVVAVATGAAETIPRPVARPSTLGLAEAAAAGRQEIRDPFFAFILGLVDADSLGTWTGADLDSFCRRLGKTSRLPLDQIVSIERRVARGSEREKRRGATVSRIWRIEMAGNLDVPVPYSILGYHPGSMRMAGEVVFSEWPLGSPNLYAVIDAEVQKFTTSGLTVLRVDTGYVLLDADGLIDKLLGKSLDDSWTLGFAFGRVDSSLMAVGIAVGRNGRKLYGEFDFAEDEILTHGHPLARSMSHYTRPWTAPPAGQSDGAWQQER